MAWRCGSLSRSLMSTARSSPSPFRPSLSRPLPRPPTPPSAPGLQSRRFSSSPLRNMGSLGTIQSLLPLQSTPCLTSHLSVAVRACCELSHGTFRRTCPDR